MKVKEYIKNNVLLLDGAMGTYFSQVSEDPLYKCEHANITSPHSVKEIHKRYLLAGAKGIKTNTFSPFDNENTSQFTYSQIIKAGYKIASEIASDFGAFVFCDIGPIKSVHGEDVIPQYKKIIDVFLGEGGENFLFETFAEIKTINILAEYIKSKNPESFIIASVAIAPDGFSVLGEQGTAMLLKAGENIDAVGYNCICGPHHMNAHIKAINGVSKPILAMPNAGYPTVIASRVNYEKSPYYFAKQMLESVENGARIIGGCCGTTPEYIYQIAERLAGKTFESKTKTHGEKIVAPIQIKKSEFFEKLISGKKPIAVELDPPKNARTAGFMQNAKAVYAGGCDMITIADCPVARARIDSSLLACKIKTMLGGEVMPHLTCRDRNINASKALLLGLSSEEINNVLIVTGDPVASANRNEVKTVYEFNSRILLNHISTFNKTLFDSPFYLYGALNINAKVFSAHLKRAKQKIESGAVAFFTQPAFSDQAIENLKRAKEELSVPIVGGIMPIVSYNNACFLQSEVPGISISEEIMAKYKDKTREQSSKIAVEISSEIAYKMKDHVDGFYLITPFNRVDIVCEIMGAIKGFNNN
ncbi:MAG: bifunctional homocysteine S-methyltransferase/methylenetetrahydrofolate reductase [Bacillota bacterium]